MTLTLVLIGAAALIGIGLYGALSQQSFVMLVMGLELMLNGACSFPLPPREGVVTVRSALLAWVGIGLLLALTVTLAYVPMGAGNFMASFTIAIAKAAVIMLVFMKLWDGRPLNRLAAGVLATWLAVLIGLTFGDYLTRPRASPRASRRTSPRPSQLSRSRSPSRR